jgi:thiamine pyrophosphate-dependent acetolactate synthase large subunit-like protein
VADPAEATEATTVAGWIGAALARDAGVRTVFGVAGSGNASLVNALTRHGARFWAARHEGVAAAMADACARVSGEIGIVTVRSGPGLTNALTALTEAAKSRTPLLVLAAEAARQDAGGYIDQPGLAAAVGVLPDRVSAASTVRNDLRRAYRTALLERRTVLLSLPLDVQPQPLTDVPLAPVRIWPKLSPAPEVIAAVADALAQAERPVFLAGRGARQARADLIDLSERAGTLLATTTAARGLFTGQPFDLDVSGALATPVAAELLAAADLVIAWGCALSDWTTRRGALLGEAATVIQVDANPAALGAQHQVDLGIPSDAGAAARAIAAELARRGQRAEGYRTPAVAKRLAAEGRWRDVPFAPGAADGRVDPRQLTIALDDLLPAARTVVTDAGNFTGYPAMFLAVPDADGLVFAQAFPAAGLGLAQALGAAVARPDRLTVAALDDAAALAGASELETAVRLSLRGLLVLVYDGADHRLADVARGYGCESVTVRAPGELGPVRAWLAGDRARPLLIDAKVTSNAPARWSSPGSDENAQSDKL